MWKTPRTLPALALIAPCCCCGDDRSVRHPDGVSDAPADTTLSGSAGIGEPELPPQPACGEVRLLELVAEAARFVPGSSVSLRTGLSAGDPGACTVQLELEVTHLGDVVHTQVQEVALAAGIEQTAVLRFQPPPDDFRGYMARLSSPASSEELSTAIDVSSSPYVFPRYGFISSFPSDQLRERSREIVGVLAEGYHTNLFQLYDWFWRHEELVARAEDGSLANTWTDLFGRSNSRATLQDIVDAIHDENGAALGYVTMYAAREDYEQLSGIPRSWGLFEQPSAEDQVSLSFGGGRYLFLFDPANPAWQARMSSAYAEAINAFDFDGVQIDQFGPHPTRYRANGQPVELNATFVPFLEAVDAALERNDPSRAACVFNLVAGEADGYGVLEVAQTSACDVLYSEIWFTTDTYEKLRIYIEQLREIGGGRAVVLALYPQYGEDVGLVLEAEDAELNRVAVHDNHAGFTGTGFVNQFESVGDSISWNLDVEQDPTVTFVFKYANASRQPATRTLFIDDEAVGKLRFPSRDSWDTWAFDAWLQQEVSPGRHEVRLAYAPDDVGVVNIDRLTLGAFDEPSVRLQNAVVFASGATPIQIGDDVQSLAHEYFPNRSKTLRPALREALRAQYSFITAHETLLFGQDVEPIAERLARIAARSDGHSLITEGSGGIWTALRRAPAGDVIHLVNLVGVDNDQWRDPAAVPALQERVSLRYEVDDASAVRDVLWATPDVGPGTFSPLAFTAGEGYVDFEVPRLAYWGVVLLRR